jgi:hypothetical protein
MMRKSGGTLLCESRENRLGKRVIVSLSPHLIRSGCCMIMTAENQNLEVLHS